MSPWCRQVLFHRAVHQDLGPYRSRNAWMNPLAIADRTSRCHIADQLSAVANVALTLCAYSRRFCGRWQQLRANHYSCPRLLLLEISQSNSRIRFPIECLLRCEMSAVNSPPRCSWKSPKLVPRSPTACGLPRSPRARGYSSSKGSIA